MTQTPTIRIDFISDISCPWCAIGLQGLEQAIAAIGDAARFEWHFQPFELDPHAPAEGKNLAQSLATKYQLDPARIAQTWQTITERGAALGFAFHFDGNTRSYNTFDAHRLLHWAGLQDENGSRQKALKQRLFQLYFSDGGDPSNHDELIRAATLVGLDDEQAHAVLREGRYADEVRTAETFWQEQGISSVPAIVLQQRFLVTGGQPPEAFERAIRQVLAEGTSGQDEASH